ncbi:MAG: hypothetical protein F9K13_07505 [Candidatus Methylomirabilis oxygeniifera]|uniref:Uncharacterized protein n=1 Tax=Methylomirabilis oxygeniifera TaxID=671143 RepID=D5MLN1_METO1|nr:MAG: hypothetical protein F9K13_07505 [Candidatus Methylomirabilis oxyfera]CBE69938.1 protein of unknown function [Candidatus Methylomirabilis oxyfera]
MNDNANEPKAAQQTSKETVDQAYSKLIETITNDFIQSAEAGNQIDPPKEIARHFLLRLKRFISTLTRGQTDHHEEIARKTYRRLRLRHVQLKRAEAEALEYGAHESLSNEKQPHQSEPITLAAGTPAPARKDQGPRVLNPALRAYHLAVTDLFVEKAIAYLEEHSARHQRNGYRASRLAIFIVALGAGLALAHLLGWESLPGANPIPIVVYHHGNIFGLVPVEDKIPMGEANYHWEGFLRFSKSFSAYGMIVLLAVFLWRYGRAMLDQSERLMERRHALRQGRLFVHLNDGLLNIEELEKAFNWNQSQPNAFANIRDDAQAPWTSVTKELSRSVADLVRAGIEATLKKGGRKHR